jgi:hypothetical protein
MAVPPKRAQLRAFNRADYTRRLFYGKVSRFSIAFSIKQEKTPPDSGVSGCRKRIFASLASFSDLFRSEKLLIENERTP